MSTRLEMIMLAKEVAKNSRCKKRRFGAILAVEDTFGNFKPISEGYNHPPESEGNCEECYRDGSKEGVDYSKCPAIHAEVDAILNLSLLESIRSYEYIIMFLYGFDPVSGNLVDSYKPCRLCASIMKKAEVFEMWGLTKDGRLKKWNMKDVYNQ